MQVLIWDCLAIRLEDFLVGFRLELEDLLVGQKAWLALVEANLAKSKPDTLMRKIDPV